MKSLKLRASLKGRHVSGAERLVGEVSEEIIYGLLKRPKEWDYLNLRVERVDKVYYLESSLKVSSYEFNSVGEARGFAKELLRGLGLKGEVVELAFKIVEEKIRRGAVLLSEEGEKLLENVRTTLMDWVDRERVEKLLPSFRTVDALVLATKNIYCGVLVELCWSDDPDYTTGYVASKELGYVRIKPLKERGDVRGGRVYFVKKENLEEVLECLRKKALLVKEPVLPPKL